MSETTILSDFRFLVNILGMSIFGFIGLPAVYAFEGWTAAGYGAGVALLNPAF